MHSKYDNMHKNGISYAIKFTNNHVISSINGMLSICIFLQFVYNIPKTLI